MRYKCLIFDHDDTTVNSTANVHYPCFVEYMEKYHPGVMLTLEEYVRYNFYPGVVGLFTDICGMTREQMMDEEEYWKEYTHHHVSEAFEGLREIMERQKAEGGYTAVVSHSFADNIARDYEHNRLPRPDMVFGWEQPDAERKPSPVPVMKIMEKFGLKPEEVLVIDDLKPGLDMARAAGVRFAAAGWCFDIPDNEKYLRANADFYCKTVEDLKKICF